MKVYADSTVFVLNFWNDPEYFRKCDKCETEHGPFLKQRLVWYVIECKGCGASFERDPVKLLRNAVRQDKDELQD